MISTQVPPEAKTAATLEVFGRAPGDLVEIPVGAKEAWVVGADDHNGEHWFWVKDAAHARGADADGRLGWVIALSARARRRPSP